MNLIEIRNLAKEFGARRILEGINLAVEKGDVVVITHETTVRELDLYTLFAQLGAHCAKYNFSKAAANHVSPLAEELLTFLQQEGQGPEPIHVQVSYEEKTGRKEFVLRDKLPAATIWNLRS